MSDIFAFSVRNGTTHNNGRSLKTTKEFEKNESKERKRNLLYLIVSYLREQNLHESADALAAEAQLGPQFEVCDNIDLDIMYQDYGSYYFTKFNKMPKIVKKATDESKPAPEAGQQRKKQKSGHTITNGQGPIQAKPSQTGTSPAKTPASDFHIDVTSLTQKRAEINEVSVTSHNAQPNGNYLSTLEKPLCDFEGYSAEWREMAELVIKEFVPKNLGITWKLCIGVNKCIDLLKEAVVYPLKYPELFNGLIAPWRGILLYGPPGTGKTLLAKALACESSTTFINVSSSSFISKWRGESEKMIKVLFDVARFYAPCTIFMDEVDALASKYDDSLHDASRRFKSELLIQLDGILTGFDNVFVLATSNSPWNLDTALLRRFEKRIQLPLPCEKARSDLFKHFFHGHCNELKEKDFKHIAEITENYSGSDIRLVCKEVLMSLVRQKLPDIQSKQVRCQDLQLRNVTLVDVVNAVEKINPPTDPEVVKKYADWAVKYGSC